MTETAVTPRRPGSIGLPDGPRRCCASWCCSRRRCGMATRCCSTTLGGTSPVGTRAISSRAVRRYSRCIFMPGRDFILAPARCRRSDAHMGYTILGWRCAVFGLGTLAMAPRHPIVTSLSVSHRTCRCSSSHAADRHFSPGWPSSRSISWSFIASIVILMGTSGLRLFWLIAFGCRDAQRHSRRVLLAVLRFFPFRGIAAVGI